MQRNGHVKFSDCWFAIKIMKEICVFSTMLFKIWLPHCTFQVHVINSSLVEYTLPSSKSNWACKPLNYSASCILVSSTDLPQFLQHGSELIRDSCVMLLLSRESLFCLKLYATKQAAVQLGPEIKEKCRWCAYRWTKAKQ